MPVITTGRSWSNMAWHDTILDHRAVESELPHSLQFCASTTVDTPHWKAERGGLEYESNDDLWKYNARDVAITAAIDAHFRSEVELRDQAAVVRLDHKLQEFTRDLHKVGMHLDRQAQRDHATELAQEKEQARRELIERARVVGMPATFNPGSTRQLADLLFDKLRLPYRAGLEKSGGFDTIAGARGTSMRVVRELLTLPVVTAAALDVLVQVHKFRRAQKFLSTFVQLRDDEEAEDEGRTPQILADGRVHFDFNVHGTVTGRFSSRSQQIPKKLRDMYAAAPGHALVAADMDQVELRFVSALAGIRKYLDVFAAGGDPHALTSDLLYGPAWREKDADQRDKLRSFAKRFQFGCTYGAQARTVWQVLRSAEGEDGGFPYLRTPEAEVVVKRQKWLAGVPELVRWWDDVVQEWRRQRYLADPIFGRRRDFLDGEDRNEIVNFKVQSGAVHVVHLAALDMREKDGIVTGYEGPGTGIIYQGHDQLVVECRKEHAEKVAAIMKKRMNRSMENGGLPDGCLPHPVVFSSKAKIGRTWKDV